MLPKPGRVILTVLAAIACGVTLSGCKDDPVEAVDETSRAHVVLSDRTPDLAWQFDGMAWLSPTQLAFTAFRRDAEDRTKEPSLYRIDVTGTGPAELMAEGKIVGVCLARDETLVYVRGDRSGGRTRVGRPAFDRDTEIDVPQRSFDACGRIHPETLSSEIGRIAETDAYAPGASGYVFLDFEARDETGRATYAIWVYDGVRLSKQSVDLPAMMVDGANRAVDQPISGDRPPEGELLWVWYSWASPSDLRSDPNTGLRLLPVIRVASDHSVSFDFFPLPDAIDETATVTGRRTRDGALVYVSHVRGPERPHEGFWHVTRQGEAEHVLVGRPSGIAGMIDPTGCRAAGMLKNSAPVGQANRRTVVLIDLCEG